jgi:O-antigen/teichoic acid export membrane protein
MLLRSLISLAAGAGLAALGYRATGVLAGIAMGYLAAGAWLMVLHRTREAARTPPVTLRRDLLRYGLPLTMTFGLDFVVNSSDRLLLGNLIGAAAVGAYAASYDLAQQGMTALMMTINLGAFPMAVRALELGGLDGARAQLLRHATVLFGVALPAAAALVVLSGNLAHVALGPEFRAGGALLIPIVGTAALLAGLKAYYFDLAFQLGRATRRQVWSSSAAAITNVLLNLLLIPRYGAAGAAWATLASFALGLGLSIVLGRSTFPMPIPVRDWTGILAGTALMCLALFPLREARGLIALGLSALGGGVVYASALLLWDVGESRAIVRRLRGLVQRPAGGGLP